MDHSSLDKTIRYAVLAILVYFVVGWVFTYLIGGLIGLLFYRYYLINKLKK